MEEKKKKKIYIVAIVALILSVLLLFVSTILVNEQKDKLKHYQDETDKIEDLMPESLPSEKFFNF